VPLGDGLRKEIMDEALRSLNTVHLGSTKMYKDLKTSYWWNNMKRDVAQFVKLVFDLSAGQSRTLETCRSTSTIVDSKWDEIPMDFVTGLPRVPSSEDAIWVVVDRLTKLAHFILMKVKASMDRLARLYVQNIMQLHVSNISYRVGT
jgi:hypothetical protein